MAETVRIFISHSHKDNAWCRVFVAALRARGADVWYDEQNLNAGVLSDEIFREIRARPIFIPVLSPAAINSEWAKREGLAAIHLRDRQVERLRNTTDAPETAREILPVVAQKCEVPLLWIGFKRFADSDDGSLPPEETAELVAQALHLPPLPAQPTTPLETSPATVGTAATPPIEQSNIPSSAEAVVKSGPFDPVAASRAITDIVDERGRFLVQYPIGLVIGLTLAGIAAVLITGYFGFTNNDGAPLSSVDSFFQKPWLLYAWLCSLIVVLQASVLRHPLVRPQLVLTLVATLMSALVAGVLVFVGIHISPGTWQSLFSSGGFVRLLPNPWTYALISFGLMAVYWYDAILRWIRQRNIVQPDPREGVLASVRLVASDLVVATLLASALGVVFQPNVFGTIMPSTLGRVNVCLISWPLGPCTPPNGPEHPVTLSFINYAQAVAYADPALVLLGVVIAIGGVGKHGLLATLRNVPSHFTLNLRSPIVLLRSLLWPGLLLLGMFSLAASSIDVQAYLHSERSFNDVLVYALPAVAWLMIALLAVTLSLAIQFFSWAVANYVLRFLGYIGFVVLLTYWIFSFAFFLFSRLLLLTGSSTRGAFTTLDYSTYVSLLFFLIFSAFAFSRTLNRGSNPKT